MKKLLTTIVCLFSIFFVLIPIDIKQTNNSDIQTYEHSTQEPFAITAAYLYDDVFTFGYILVLDSTTNDLNLKLDVEISYININGQSIDLQTQLIIKNTFNIYDSTIIIFENLLISDVNSIESVTISLYEGEEIASYETLFIGNIPSIEVNDGTYIEEANLSRWISIVKYLLIIISSLILFVIVIKILKKWKNKKKSKRKTEKVKSQLTLFNY